MRPGRANRLPAELNAEQWRQVERIREQWLRAAMSTAPADRSAAERAVSGLYRLAGRQAPRFVWVGSPAGALLAIWLLSGGYGSPGGLWRVSFREVLADALWELIGPALRDSVWAALRDGLGDELSFTSPRSNLLQPKDWHPPPAGSTPLHRAREELGLLPGTGGRTQVERSLCELLPYPVMAEWLIRDELRESLGVRLQTAYRRDRRRMSRQRRLLWRSLIHQASNHDEFAIDQLERRYWGGQHDASESCADELFRRFGTTACSPEAEACLDFFATTVRSCGPLWTYPKVCVISERPVRLRAEPWRPAGSVVLRLHCQDGPALAYRDGFALHAWHGVRVPRRVIAGELTGADWLYERNAEIRRVIAERMGFAWLLEHCGARRIAADEYGTLWRIPDPRSPDGHDMVVVDVLNSTREPDGTPRRYILRVPPDQTVPRDAIGWTFGLPPDAYGPTAMT